MTTIGSAVRVAYLGEVRRGDAPLMPVRDLFFERSREESADPVGRRTNKHDGEPAIEGHFDLGAISRVLSGVNILLVG